MEKGDVQGGLLADPMVQALLEELAAKLAALAQTGRTDCIDLRRLPLPNGTLDALRAWLGTGEVTATIRSLGVSQIQETGVAGVWWVEQAKPSGEPLGVTLDICECPAVLVADRDDVRTAVATLLRKRQALASSG